MEDEHIYLGAILKSALEQAPYVVGLVVVIDSLCSSAQRKVDDCYRAMFIPLFGCKCEIEFFCPRVLKHEAETGGSAGESESSALSKPSLSYFSLNSATQISVLLAIKVLVQLLQHLQARWLSEDELL